MLTRLFEQYHLDAMLQSLIGASIPDSAWWVLGSHHQLIFGTKDILPPDNSDMPRWELALAQFEGVLVCEQDDARSRALGTAIASLLTLLLENEIQRQANESERQVAQLESRIHYRLSQSLGTAFRRTEISLLILQEVQRLVRSTGAIVYVVGSGRKSFLLDGHIGETPYGKTPPPQLPKGLIYQSAQRGETLWLNTEAHAEASVAERNARHILALPIRLHDHFYAVLALFNRQSEFSSRDLRLLRVLTNYAAIAYHNADALRALADVEDDASHDVIFRSGENDWQEVFEHNELDWKELGD